MSDSKLHAQWTFDQQYGCWWIHARECRICLQPRPIYCDRGNWYATIDATPGSELARDLDQHDGWPRYYFDLQRAKAEVEAWLIKRNQIDAVPIPDEFAGTGPRIEEMFAFIADDGSGEGITGFASASGWMPMVGADIERVESLMPIARQLAAESGKSIIVAKFSQRTNIDSISAPQAAFDAMVPRQGVAAIHNDEQKGATA